MSELAAQYYTERAEQLGISSVPDILNGEPIPLLEGQSLSVHSQPNEKVEAITSILGDSLTSLHEYVWAGVSGDPVPATKITRSMEFSHSQLLKHAVSSLIVPRDAITGSITDIQLEAVSRQEIEPVTFNKVTKGKFEDARDESGSTEFTEANLVLSALFRNGARRESIAALLVVRATSMPETDKSLAYTGIRYARDRIAYTAITGTLLADGPRQTLDAQRKK